LTSAHIAYIVYTALRLLHNIELRILQQAHLNVVRTKECVTDLYNKKNKLNKKLLLPGFCPL